MHIGIVSMQRVINYGSFLQGFALKRILEELGYEVSFVDIKKGNNIIVRKTSKTSGVKIDKFILKRIEHTLFKKKRTKKFNVEYFSTIGINTPAKEEECDKIVIGSDEVFNCCQASAWGFTTQLFGNTACPAITYAASAGYSNMNEITNLGIASQIENALKKLSAISVRDDNTLSMVESFNLKALKHLDPVLIFDWNKVIKPIHRYKDYILIYAYDNRINDEDEIKAIKKFARQQHKKIISFGVYQRWCDKNVLCSPLELIAYFDAADYVITDTFHGTVISIKRNKKFATIIRDSNKNKLKDLLSTFGLTNREITNVANLEYVITNEINYQNVNTIIKTEVDRTMKYLHENL